ncbi:MAG: hypothetical protein QXO54_02800 [Candidatus Methanomethylicaceae archaeon]
MTCPVCITDVAFTAPTIHGMPSSRLTMAAWHVIPPLLVTIALAFLIAGAQSGDVIWVTNISPAWNWLMSFT